MTKKKTQPSSSSLRGGYRENAGRKSSWNHRDTCTIRIPKPFAEQLVELAHRLDNGESLDTDTESNLQGYDSRKESIQLGADLKDSPTATAGKAAIIDTDTESKLAVIDSLTESITAKAQNTEKVTSQTDKLGKNDTVTESKPAKNDTGTKSITSNSDPLTQLACQPASKETSDSDTESNPPEYDNVTESNWGSEHQTLTQSIPDLNEALSLALTIIKAKKSARESIARLLSKLYSAQVTPDDLR